MTAKLMCSIQTQSVTTVGKSRGWLRFQVLYRGGYTSSSCMYHIALQGVETGNHHLASTTMQSSVLVDIRFNAFMGNIVS